MRILVGCESSGVLSSEFRALGHEVWSCDLLEGAIPRWHIRGDLLSVLEDRWDLMVAHPSCRYLSVSGIHWNTNPKHERGRDVVDGLSFGQRATEEGLAFVRKLMNAPIGKIAIENPISVISSRIRPPDCIVQPFEHGDPESKKTCLWLKNLPAIVPTNLLPPARWACCSKYLEPSAVCPECLGAKRPLPRWENQTASGQNKLSPDEDRWAVRSKTYRGIARAMAAQWTRPVERGQLALF